MAVRQLVQQRAVDRDLIFAYVHSLPAPDRHTVADLVLALQISPPFNRPSSDPQTADMAQWIEKTLLAGISAVQTKPIDPADVIAIELGRCCLATFSRFPRVECAGLDHKRFLDHSLAVACIAIRLASVLDGVPLGTAFLAGLLHDIGKAAFNSAFPKSYLRVLQDTRCTTRTDTEAELDIFGIDHAQVGARLAQHWRLPREVVDAVLHHGRPTGREHDSAGTGLNALVTLANALAYSVGFGVSVHTPNGLADPILRAWNLADSTVASILEGLPARVEAATRQFGCAADSISEFRRRPMKRTSPETVAAQARAGDLMYSHSQSRTIRLLSRFCDSLRADDTVLDVCLALAETLETVVVHQKFVVWGLNSQMTLMHAAGCGPTGIISHIRPVDSLPDAGASTAPWAELVRRYWPDYFAAGRYRLFESRRGTHLMGGLMMESSNTGSDADPDTCQLISQALGLALAEARAREDSLLQMYLHIDQRRRDESEHGKLLRTRSVEVLSHLAAGAAHEMNNPLAVISGRAQLLLGQEGLNAPARKSIEAIRAESQRCSAIISELMLVAKPAEPQPVAFSLRGMLESARSRALLDFGLTLDQFELSVADEALAVFADPAQISTVLDALIRNALEAGPLQSIKVSINSTSRPTDDSCVIVLKDNGRGMTPEALASALDPFFSSRQAGRGRGLGLSRALRLVERNRGRLDIESSPGRGTRVVLSLPTRTA